MKDRNTTTISGLADAAGVNIETIRYYQRKKLVPEPERPIGGIRHYGATALARVRFIKSAQRLGFSLEEVGELLKLEDGTHCDEARLFAEHKLADVRKKLADLRRMESALTELIKDCCASEGLIKCPLIAALQTR